MVEGVLMRAGGIKYVYKSSSKKVYKVLVIKVLVISHQMYSTRQICSTVVFLTLIGTMIALFSMGYLQTWAIAVGDLQMWGHCIFILFFIISGLPFGWGFTIFVQTTGFVYGWIGLITAEVGCLLGSIVGFVTSRYCLRKWSLRQIEKLPEAHQHHLTTARNAVSQGVSPCLFFSALRTTPALTFGWVNSLCALTDMRLPYFLLTTIIGSQLDLVLNIYLGKLMRETSEVIGTNSTSTTTAEVLSIQIVLTILLLIGTTMWGRRLLNKIRRRQEVGCSTLV